MSKANSSLAHALAPLRSLLEKPNLTEICINKPGEIWTEEAGQWIRHSKPEMDFAFADKLCKLVYPFNGHEISNTPVLSGTLPPPGRERIQIVRPPVCTPGTISITIRKPSQVNFTLSELKEMGSFNQVEDVGNELRDFEKELLRLLKNDEIEEFLRQAVLHKRNITITGATGSGKTTVSKSLVREIPKTERLITLEDVHELFLEDHPNKVHLFYKREVKKNSVTAKSALESCLRMKPDRILLAELRGDEAWEYVKSINNGHPGSITSMHANGAYESFEQLASLIKDSSTGSHLEFDYLKRRLMTTIDVVLFYKNYRLREIYYRPEVKYENLA